MPLVHNFVFIDLLLNLLLLTQCKSEYVPALIWSSSEFNNRKNAEDLVLTKIKSELFESYVLEVIGNNIPIISVFLEENLGTDDFEWKDETKFKSFPYLSNLSVNSRVDYFRFVENPHEIIEKLSKKIYKLNQNIGDSKEVESDLLLIEFKRIGSEREKTLKSHDEILQNVSKRIENSGRDWICIFTGKHSTQKDVVTEIKEMSSWHVDHHFVEKPSRVISIYEDRFTKLALVTRGSIQLLLPSPKNLAYKNLEVYKKTAVVKKEKSTDFVIWFSNYTLTLYLDTNGIIKSGKVENEKEDELILFPSFESINEEPVTEFQSQGKPFVKVKINKYKFTKIQYFKEPCDNTFKFQVVAVCTAVILGIGLFFWFSITKNLDFSVKLKIVKIPLESILSKDCEE